MLARTVRLQRLPSMSALSCLDQAPAAIVDRLRGFVRDGVVERIRASGLRSITLDFDGTVQSTQRRAETSAVGYNSQHKGEHSYYPLLGTVSHLGEVFNVPSARQCPRQPRGGRLHPRLRRGRARRAGAEPRGAAGRGVRSPGDSGEAR